MFRVSAAVVAVSLVAIGVPAASEASAVVTDPSFVPATAVSQPQSSDWPDEGSGYPGSSPSSPEYNYPNYDPRYEVPRGQSATVSEASNDIGVEIAQARCVGGRRRGHRRGRDVAVPATARAGHLAAGFGRVIRSGWRGPMWSVVALLMVGLVIGVGVLALISQPSGGVGGVGGVMVWTWRASPKTGLGSRPRWCRCCGPAAACSCWSGSSWGRR